MRKKLSYILTFMFVICLLNISQKVDEVYANSSYNVSFIIDEGGCFYYEDGPASHSETVLNIKTDSVSFDSNRLLMYGCTFKEQAGYKLVGWRRIENGKETDEIYYSTDEYFPTEDTEFKAVMEYIGYVTVTFHYNDSSIEDYSENTDDYGRVYISSYELPTKFVECWETSNGEKVSINNYYTTNENIDLYAVWTDCSYVTYNLNGGYWPGPSGSSREVAPLAKPYYVSSRTDFIKDGFVFTSYSIKGDETGKEYYPGEEIEVNKDIELVANWVEDTGKKHTVTYDLDSGYYMNGPAGECYGSVTREYPEVITKIHLGEFDGPYKDDFEFVGWKKINGDDTIYDSSIYDPEKGGYIGGLFEITEDVSFKAVWNESQHHLVIDKAIPPTCTDTGLSEGSHCSECGETIIKQQTVPATGHKWITVMEEKSTCQQAGYILKKCSVCGVEQKTTIQKKAHIEVIDKAVAPTTTSTGLTEGKHCSVCGKVLVKQIVLPTITNDKDSSETYSNEWVDGKWYNADGTQTYAGTLNWKKDSTSWWVEDTDGWYPADSWQKIDGVWYYFKPDGYAVADEYYNGYWFNKDGSWDPQYKLSWKSNATGWWVEDISGWWPQSSWLKIDGCWYYFDGSGYMVTSRYIDGWWIGADGVCR